MAISRAGFWLFIIELVARHPNLGIPALEDGLFAKLLIFDYSYYKYLCLGKEKGREKGREKGKGKRAGPVHEETWFSISGLVRFLFKNQSSPVQFLFFVVFCFC